VHLDQVSHPVRIASSVGAIAIVTGVIYLLDLIAPTVSLLALYLFAVVPIAIAWGLWYGIPASIASMLTFNFLFLPPLYTFTLADEENWVALAVFLVIAVVVSDLTARIRRRAAEAEQREREEALLAEVATAFLEGRSVEDELESVAQRVAQVLKADRARVQLGPQRDPPAGESPLELRVGGQRVGTLYLKEGAEPNLSIRRRFLPALASLLAVASERERLAHESVETAALRRSDTIKTAVLQAVSHDLQSPLTAIIAAVGSLRSQTLQLASEDRDALLETIDTEAARLEKLIRDLLDLSRLQAGAATPELELWTADELVAQAIDDLGPQGKRIRVSLPPDLPPIRVDAGQIRRALANLLDNAIKFSPPDGEVVVRATATRKDVVLRVVDHGPGLPPDQQDLVFEPFHRAGGAARGSGLGLAITKGFAEANGGRVWVESRPGQGCSFALALEAAPVPAVAGR
jgi:two-component system, OmpR family, sensor histidine kinase KdpD